MALDDYGWRPITFQGVKFPATLMAADVIDSALEIEDEEFSSWLLRLTVCRGVTKSASAKTCARCAQKAVDLMLEHRQRILDYIGEWLSPHGFEPDTTFRDWIGAFQEIVELSGTCEGECYWSAPSHERDDPNAAEKLLRALERERARLLDEQQNG
jgi:hypothetical protein